MKKIYLLISLAIISFAVSSCSSLKGAFGGYADGFSTCFCYKGQWSTWEKHYFPSSYLREYNDWQISCTYGPGKHIIGLQLKSSGGNEYFSFLISDYQSGKKDCTGTVEYYVNDTYPTAEALARANHFVKPNYRTDITPSVKRTAKARIKIVNNGSKPATFNLWFDNIGIGIDVQNVYWH